MRKGQNRYVRRQLGELRILSRFKFGGYPGEKQTRSEPLSYSPH